MEIRPTKKQKELLNFIDGFIKGNGYAPSYREVMRALDYKSVSTVATHVDGLITRGWLVKRDNSARSLEVMMPDMASQKTDDGQEKQVSAEREIMKKLDELRGTDTTANKKEIQTLLDALEILGYTEKKSSHLL